MRNNQHVERFWVSAICEHLANDIRQVRNEMADGAFAPSAILLVAYGTTRIFITPALGAGSGGYGQTGAVTLRLLLNEPPV